MRVEGQGMARERSAFNAEAPKKTSNEAEKTEERAKLGKEDIIPTGSINEEELKAATDTINEALKITNYHCQFRIHKESGRLQVKIIDDETNEVIKQIPPESALELSANIKKMLANMVGILVDESI